MSVKNVVEIRLDGFATDGIFGFFGVRIRGSLNFPSSNRFLFAPQTQVVTS